MTQEPTITDAAPSGVLRSELVLEYPFARSTGPVVGAFLTALREGFVVGVRRSDGSVLVPPLEYDPDTAEPLTEIVEVGDTGEVVAWCWQGEPRELQPFGQPFAWALVRLDGADTPMVHAVAAASPDDVRTGMRVRARWRAEREGHITDIECFEPEPSTEAS